MVATEGRSIAYLRQVNAAELILNPDGSVYHLNLMPDEIAPIVILVGDPDRVAKVSRHFDRIDVMRRKREFITHTGWVGPTRLSVVSSGIGTDNIDIVLNELDALANIDLPTRTVLPEKRQLLLIRAGTSGSIHPAIRVDDIVISAGAIGLDILGRYYGATPAPVEGLPDWAYYTPAQGIDLGMFPDECPRGITLTCAGFYGPQGRILRLTPHTRLPIDAMHAQSVDGYPLTNLEMETSAIYLLADKLGHRAVSVNTILAQRLEGRYSSDPARIIERMIRMILERAGHLYQTA